MATKSRFRTLLLLPIIMLTGFQCSGDQKLVESVPETEFIDNCPDMLYDFGDLISVGDPIGKFMISLPYSWDIRESYGDTLYGVFASNFLSIPIPVEDRMSISLTGYTTKLPIKKYVYNEIAELVREENTAVLERGTTMFAGRQNPWILFRMKPGIYNMVYYYKNPEKEDIFLLQSVSYDTVNYKIKLCYLKQLINSFEEIKY